MYKLQPWALQIYIYIYIYICDRHDMFLHNKCNMVRHHPQIALKTATLVSLRLLMRSWATSEMFACASDRLGAALLVAGYYD